jgi:O-antigen/teichoic acid export membrane protein
VLFILILSRLLSAEGYGHFATILAMASLCQTFGFAWIQTSILRLLPDQSAEDVQQFARAVVFAFVLSSVVISCVWIISFMVLSASVNGLSLCLAGLFMLLCNSWAAVCQSWNRSEGRHWRYAISQAIDSSGSLAIAFAGFMWWRADPSIFVAAVALGSLLSSFVIWIPVSYPTIEAHELKPWLIEMWSYGTPLTAVSLGFVSVANVDRLLIAGILGPAAAGSYSIASSLAIRAITLPLLPISQATRPLVFFLYSRHGATKASRLLTEVSKWLVAIAFPVTVLLMSGSDVIASVVVGRDLAAPVAALLPLTAVGALLFAFVSLHFALGFQVVRQTKWMLAVVAPTAIFNVLCNLILIPRFGTAGAAWTMITSFAVALLFAISLGKRHFPVPFAISHALRAAAACVPLALFSQLEFERSLFGLSELFGGGALIYTAAAVALNVADARTHLMRGLAMSKIAP